MDAPLSTSRGAPRRKDWDRVDRRDREERACTTGSVIADAKGGSTGRGQSPGEALRLDGPGAEADPETRKQAEAEIKKLEQEREDALNQKNKAAVDKKKFADDYERVKAELDRIKASQTQEAAPPPPPPPPKND